MAKKRIRMLRKDGRGWGKHHSGEILICIHCGKEMKVGFDSIVSKMVASVHAYTKYYCLEDAQELNIYIESI